MRMEMEVIRILLCARATMTRVAGLAALMVAGCAADAPLRIRLADSVERPVRSVVIFFIDGLDRGRFAELLEAGRLPAIERRFVRGGVRVEHAIVSLPAITYPNTVSLLTGQFPGHHGVLGNRWFDRHTLQSADYSLATTYRRVNEDFQCPTLYERLSDHFTVSIQCPTRRGVSHTIDNPITSGIDWLLGEYTHVDARSGAGLEEVVGLANRVGRWPSVLLHYFPGVDEVGHRFGSDSSRYAAALVNADRQVGRVADAIDRAGLGERTYFVLVTDHGHVPTRADRTVDLIAWLRQRCHLRVCTAPPVGRDYATRLARVARYDAVAINGVYRRIAIHLRGPRGWGMPADDELVQRVLAPAGPTTDRLVDQPGVGLVCRSAGAGRVIVASRNGTAIIERRQADGVSEYRVKTQAGVDPLRARTALAPFIDAGWHASRAWLAATADTRFPDFPVQVVEMFDSPRAGDLVVFAAEGWAFSARDRGGHGSCLAEDMRGVLLFSGPDLPRGATIRHARIVDVLPTILDLLGERDRLNGRVAIDGVSIAAELRNAHP